MAVDETASPAEWWLPGRREEKQAPGLYRVRPTGGAEVELHGSLTIDDHPFAFMDRENPPYLIHGLSFGTPVTLLRTRYRSSRSNLSGAAHTVAHPWLALEGLLLDDSELSVTDVTVQFFDQGPWTEWSSFSYSMTDNPAFFESATYQRPAEPTYKANGVSVSLIDASSFRPSHSNSPQIVLTSEAMFKLQFDNPIAFSDLFNYWLAPLEFLVVTATGRPSGISSLRCTNSTWIIDGEDSISDRWLTVRVNHAERPTNWKPATGLLHRRTDFDWAAQMPRAFSSPREHAFTVQQYMFLSGSKTAPLAEFMASAQLVESFDRSLHSDLPRDEQAAVGQRVAEVLREAGISGRYRDKISWSIKMAHEPSLETRLRRMNQECGDVFQQDSFPATWCSDVARLRNVVSHGLPGANRLSRDLRAAQAGSEMLLLLFHARWLIELGFTPTRAVDLVRKRDNHWQRVGLIRECYPALQELLADSTGNA